MKILFVIVVVGYLTGGAIGWYYNTYTDLISMDEAFRRLILPNVCFTIALATAMVFIVKKAVPEYVRSEKTHWKVFRIVAFAIASFFINQGYIRILNCSIGKQEPIMIEGTIIKKEVKERYRKLRKRQRYFITVEDNLTKQVFRFRIKEPVYELYKHAVDFKKEMYIGSLGIIYRNEQ